MEITQYRTVSEELVLTQNTIKKVTIQRLEQFLNGGEYLREEKGKMLLKMDDPHWRHGSVSEHTVREATELDIAVFTVIKALQKSNEG